MGGGEFWMIFLESARPRPRAQARHRPVWAGSVGGPSVERGPSRCAPPRWRASARAAGGWRDLPTETLSTLACAGSTVVVRGWCALIGWPALGTWLCATGWTRIAWSWIAPVLNGPLAGRHRPRWPWHLAPPAATAGARTLAPRGISHPQPGRRLRAPPNKSAAASGPGGRWGV